MNELDVVRNLLREVVARAVVQHQEARVWPHRGEYWQWGECRLCLFTWRGMIPDHADDCPMWDLMP